MTRTCNRLCRCTFPLLARLLQQRKPARAFAKVANLPLSMNGQEAFIVDNFLLDVLEVGYNIERYYTLVILSAEAPKLSLHLGSLIFFKDIADTLSIEVCSMSSRSCAIIEQ